MANPPLPGCMRCGYELDLCCCFRPEEPEPNVWTSEPPTKAGWFWAMGPSGTIGVAQTLYVLKNPKAGQLIGLDDGVLKVQHFPGRENSILPLDSMRYWGPEVLEPHVPEHLKVVLALERGPQPFGAQVGTQTGRLSSSDINLQNAPRRNPNTILREQVLQSRIVEDEDDLEDYDD